MISIVKANKSFRGMRALDNVELTFAKGKSYALIGPNGSGKTTLIKSILGLVVLTSGEIYIDGNLIQGDWKYRELIGYMPQIGRFPENITIGHLMDMMKNIRRESALDEELLKRFELEHIFNKRMHTLSGGTRQKVSAALAFLFDPPIIILDEPTAGLDPVSAEILKEKIIKEKRKGKLVIITSHIMSELEDLATDVAFIFEGKIQFNDPIEILKDETGEDRLGKAIAALITKKQLFPSARPR